MADTMEGLFAAGQNIAAPQTQRGQDELVFNMNAHAFFVTFGKPERKVEHQFFTKKDGKSKLEGFGWNRPFRTPGYQSMIREVYIGKNLAADGMGLKELAAELEKEDTTYEIHIRKGSEEAYIAKPRSISSGSVDEFFSK